MISSERQVETRSTLRLAASAALVMAVLLLTGCDEGLTDAPPIEGTFTLFGIMNPKADTQAVFVYPIQQETLTPLEPTALDAVVTSTDLETGEVRAWQDSLVFDRERGYAHVYWSAFRAEFGRTYRIDAVRFDGEATHVLVEVPPQVAVDEHDVGTRQFSIFFRGDRFRVLRAKITYGVRYWHLESPVCPDAFPLFNYTFVHDGEARPDGGGWALHVNLRDYLLHMREYYEQDYGGRLWDRRDPNQRLALQRMKLEISIGDEAWTIPHGFADRSVLANPETLTNVANGMGFVGAGYRDETPLLPSAEAVREAGFFDYMEERIRCEMLPIGDD